jgi:hypothetical protein
LSLKVTPKSTDGCMDDCQPIKDRTEVTLALVNHLKYHLGYQVICLDLACPRVPDTPYTDAHLAAWTSQLSDWTKDHGEGTPLPPELVPMINLIKTTYAVDGVLLVHGRLRYKAIADTAHWMGTLTASMAYQLLRGDYAKLQANIIAGKHPEIIWSNEATTGQIGIEHTWPASDAANRYGPDLLGELEPCRVAGAGR